LTPLLEAFAVGRLDRRTGTWLLRNVNLAIQAGDRLRLQGLAGAGKTLLLRSLAMIDVPDEGEIRLRGQAVRGAAVPELRRRVIYLHQKPTLFPGTVRENLGVPYRLNAWRESSFDETKAIAWLDELGRPASFLDKQAADLSGGESQIVALLRARQLDPEGLLSDEATSALDAATAEAAEKILLDWFRQGPNERAFVWVSHGEPRTGAMFTRRLMLHQGRLENDA
jgi:putative ABC transport system ATP-binding protein